MSETIKQVFVIALNIFDVVLSMIFFNIMLKNRKEWANKWIFYMSFVGSGVVIYFTSIIANMWTVILLVSLIVTFLLTFLYESKIRARIFVAVSYQVFLMLSETIAVVITSVVLSYRKVDNPVADVTFYSFLLSKLIVLIFIIIIKFIIRKSDLKSSVKDYVFLITVPLLSALIIISILMDDKSHITENSGFNTGAVFGILIINFIVYYMLNSSIKANALREKQTRMETQFFFQEKKYEQTSMSFKKISSIIHDTNKHLVYLRECAVEGRSDESISYINTALNQISTSYKRINTGFLVIDALVSNAYNFAELHKIRFKTDIKIDKDKIMVERYDLSVALGNLLDNACEACIKVTNTDDRFMDVNVFTTESALVINIINAVGMDINNIFSSAKDDDKEHGYGIKNVNNIAEKYGGSFIIDNGDSTFEVTLILPIKD